MLGLKIPDGGAKAEKTKLVRGWAREALGLSEDVSVLVTELTCTEPGCPPVETIIAVLRGPGDNLQIKIHRPIVELTREDVVKGAS